MRNSPLVFCRQERMLVTTRFDVSARFPRRTVGCKQKSSQFHRAIIQSILVKAGGRIFYSSQNIYGFPVGLKIPELTDESKRCQLIPIDDADGSVGPEVPVKQQRRSPRFVKSVAIQSATWARRESGHAIPIPVRLRADHVIRSQQRDQNHAGTVTQPTQRGILRQATVSRL